MKISKIMTGIQCSEFTFYNDFDSANLSRVEYIPPNESVLIKPTGVKGSVPELPDAEFNIWTKPDCLGTEFENGNRTWFYFGMKANEPSMLVKFNLVDLNKQAKMYSQGMAPVYRILPGKPQWERIRDKPTYNLEDNIFTLTFKFRTSENPQSIMYFAFTYPYSYIDLERHLVNVDMKYLKICPVSEDDIYYTRECVCRSLGGRNVDLITISSYHGITTEREERLRNLFPDKETQRPFKFVGKKIVFVSARVHPGETPSSFVFNGFLNLLLNRDDLIAIHLRKLYVFKLIPFLNPDGVACGHYRTDTRGVNLNRVYMNPRLNEHPSVYAARALIRYYHFGFEKEDILVKCDNCKELQSSSTDLEETQQNINKKVSHMTLEEGDAKPSLWCGKCKDSIQKLEGAMPGISSMIPTFNLNNSLGSKYCRNCGSKIDDEEDEKIKIENVSSHGDVNSNKLPSESGLFLYVDLHGHASKKGIFMYGNHFENLEDNVECMLLPKLMSINNHNFHFNSCNFTERNMFIKDKRDGMSRAGSGRVSVLSITGTIKSYTLECNYNTGRIVNILAPTIKEPSNKMHTLPMPPKYTPQVFEEVGKCLGASILDLTSQNPVSRLPNTEFRTLGGLREWLATNSCQETLECKTKARGKRCISLQNQAKPARGVPIKSRPPLAKSTAKKNSKSRLANIPLERKENLGFLPGTSTSQPSCSIAGTKSNTRVNKCFGFKAKSRKEMLLKTKNTADLNNPGGTPRKKSNITPQKVRLDMSAKLQNVKDKEKKKDDDMQVKEICYIKNDAGKTVIAKYKGKDDGLDDNLVVSWDNSNPNAQIYTQKGKIMPTLTNKTSAEPGTSQQMGSFRIHNFSKNASSSKTKIKKNTLRRLSTQTESVGKIDKKKKKKKLKAK